MAYMCPWPCVFDTVPSPVAQSVPSATVQTISVTVRSFVVALAGQNVIDDRPLPTPCIKGDALSIRICQDEYHKGVEECKNALKAHLTLNKGDKLYSACDLSTKIGKHRKTSAAWKMVPPDKGYYDFHFDSADDLRKIWTTGTVKDFKYLSQNQTHVLLWIHLVELPQEYWRERTLKEIASAVGTSINIDEPTRNCTFGHYARTLVDIDLSNRAYDEILVEREGFAFKVEVQYERRLLFCYHCYSIGHNVSTCRWLHLQPPKDKNDRGKQIIIPETAPPKPSWQNNDVGASTSYNGSTWTWVPVVSTVATTERVLVSATPTSLALTTLDIPALSPTLNANSQLGPISIVTSTIATSSTDVSIPSLSSNSFIFPLHNVFDMISPKDLPRVTPVLEVVSPIAHVDVHSERAEQLYQTLQEELENPMVDDVTVTLSDDVEHNHSIPRELVESHKGSHERVSHLSHVKHIEVHEVSVESVQVQTDTVVEYVDVHSGSRNSLVLPVVIEQLLAENVSMPTTIQEEQVVPGLQQQEVHPNKNI